MRKILMVIVFFICTETWAQNKGIWQVFIEPTAMNVNNLKQSLFFTGYKVLDSAGGKFKKNHYEISEEITSKIKPGIAAGVRYNYTIAKTLTLNAGMNISSYNTDRDITFNSRILDSSTITLAGSGPTWIDPSNGYILQWISSSPQPWGSMFGNSGIWIVNQPPQQQRYRHATSGTEKINLITLEIPVGATFTPKDSKFSFNVEISPVLLIKSSVSVKYKETSEILPPEPPSYTFTNTQWRLAAGISYRINKSFEAGLNYKHYLSPMLDEEDIKIKSIGLQIRYTLPLKNHL